MEDFGFQRRLDVPKYADSSRLFADETAHNVTQTLPIQELDGRR